jgi:hypothetical protein
VLTSGECEGRQPNFAGGRAAMEKAGSSSTGRWCSGSSPAMGRGETDADRCRGSCGSVDLLWDGSCLEKQEPNSDGG